jgi:hypothetical protein
MIEKGKSGSLAKTGDGLAVPKAGVAVPLAVFLNDYEKLWSDREYKGLANEEPCADYQQRWIKIPFAQNADNCAAFCAAYLSLRLNGIAIPNVLNKLAGSNIRSSVKTLHANYRTAENEAKTAGKAAISPLATAGKSQHLSQLLTQMHAQIRADLKQTPAPLKNEIVFIQAIGGYTPTPRDFPPSMYDAFIKQGDNIVLSKPMPLTRWQTSATTLQAALFFEYKAPVPVPVVSKLLHDKACAAAKPATLTPTGFVYLSFCFVSAAGQSSGHALLVDFTDARRPGIFDPNFGWLETRQGYCTLEFEQIIYESWRRYTKWNSKNGKRGIKNLDIVQDRRFMILAFQVYLQTLE